jgi:foldase protein PrsA
MTAARIFFGLLLASLALAATACGGGSDSVPSDAVAVVNGTEISKAQLAEYMELTKKGYERTKQPFPKAGTPEYQDIQTRNVSYLVELVQLQQAAEDLEIEVTDKDVDKLENATIKSKFDGKRADYEKALEKAGYTAEQYRNTAYLYAVLSSKIFRAVTNDVVVTPQEVLQYYTANQSQYGSPRSREVRHILLQVKDKDGNVDFAASKAKADDVYAQLEGGADFAALVKKYSADTGSVADGGKYSVVEGQGTVAEFEKAAFALATNEISKPVKTQFGYHIIEPIEDTKKATVQPLEEVQASIKALLLQQKRNEKIQKWVEDQKSAYDGKINYAAGYEPPAVPDAPTDTTQ